MRNLAHVRAVAATVLLLVLGTPALAQFVDGMPAEGVLGPTDFTTRPSAATTDSQFNGPNGVAVDPLTGKLFVVDRGNHRVLRWSSVDAMVDGAAAEAVLGQTDFVTGTSGLSATRFNNPIGACVDAVGRLWIGDFSNNRVLRFDDASNKATGAAADAVLGQPDFVTGSSGTTADKMGGPVGVFLDADGILWVSNFNNHRVLRFDDAANKPDGAAADGVLGQPDFTSGSSSLSQTGMANPNDVVVDASGNLYVSDYANRRVLRFDAAAIKANGAAADGVLGKPDFVTGGSMLSQTTMGTTRYVEVDAAGHLYVVGEGNNRMLVFNDAATLPNGAPADFVIGQPDFDTSTILDPPTASSLRTPRAVEVDETNHVLWLADWANQRVLRYPIGSTTEPNIILVSPSGGEEWLSGSTHAITWGVNMVATLTIEYSTDDGASWQTIASGVDASLGTYAWIVPAAPTTTARVRLSDEADSAVNDIDAQSFTIAMPVYTIMVESPNGSQQWEVGSSQHILFTAVNLTSVDVEVSDDGGSTWTTVAAAAPASDGSVAWTVPDGPGDQYLMRVTDADGSGATDTSDEMFAVVLEVTGDEFDEIFFRDSPTPDYYDPSYVFANTPSTFVSWGSSKIPVATERSLRGNYSLSFEWNSQVGGDWGAAVASLGWLGHDVAQRDSLVFWVYTDEPIDPADLPCIYLEDLSNAKTEHLPLSDYLGAITSAEWQRVALDLQVFRDHPGSADLTRIKTIFFGQQAADGVAHHWFMDDVRMTGGEILTGLDVPTIVVLGSSTAAGTGASSPDSSWVGRYRHYVVEQDSTAQVVNLAIGGFTTYNIMPDGYEPPAGRPGPSPGHNITRALAYDPWAIIINLPSNDITSGFTIEEQLANYDVVLGLAADADIPVWISTTQPRNLPTQEQRDLQHTMADTTLTLFGDHAVDFWYGLAAADGTILPEYDSGDGIHLNDSGHAVLYGRVVARDIWNQITAVENPYEDDTPTVPGATRLFQNAPNPFNPSTKINFSLNQAGDVTLAVYDLRGHQVRRLVAGAMVAGDHTIVWDGKNDRGQPTASGVYFYRLQTPARVLTRSMLMVK